jgi:hypothetical protein
LFPELSFYVLRSVGDESCHELVEGGSILLEIVQVSCLGREHLAMVGEARDIGRHAILLIFTYEIVELALYCLGIELRSVWLSEVLILRLFRLWRVHMLVIIKSRCFLHR